VADVNLIEGWDDGINVWAIKGYAVSRGIGYEEAKQDMLTFQANNPAPEPIRHKRGQHATREDARQTFHLLFDRYKTHMRPYEDLEPRYGEEDLEPAF